MENRELKIYQEIWDIGMKHKVNNQEWGTILWMLHLNVISNMVRPEVQYQMAMNVAENKKPTPSALTKKEKEPDAV